MATLSSEDLDIIKARYESFDPILSDRVLFIAYAREDVPVLVAEVKSLRSELKAAQDVLIEMNRRHSPLGRPSIASCTCGKIICDELLTLTRRPGIKRGCPDCDGLGHIRYQTCIRCHGTGRAAADPSDCDHEFTDHCRFCGVDAHEWFNRGAAEVQS